MQARSCYSSVNLGQLHHKGKIMSAPEAYMRESEKIVAKLGFWSEEFRRFRDWWQQNGSCASRQEVEMVAARIWRERGGG